MIAATCFRTTSPSSGSVPSAFWEMNNGGAVDRILWLGVLRLVTWCVHHVTRHNTPAIRASFMMLFSRGNRKKYTVLLRSGACGCQIGGVRWVDFFLFPRLKSIMECALFADVAAIRESVTAVLRSIPQEACADSFHKLYERCQQCVVKGWRLFCRPFS
jgi:hypothetical protein